MINSHFCVNFALNFKAKREFFAKFRHTGRSEVSINSRFEKGVNFSNFKGEFVLRAGREFLVILKAEREFYE